MFVVVRNPNINGLFIVCCITSGDTGFLFTFSFSGGSHGMNPTLIITKLLQTWTLIRQIGAPSLRNTGVTLGRTCTLKPREDPLLSKMTVSLGINVIQPRRTFTPGDYYRRIVMLLALKMTGGFPRCKLEQEIDTEEASKKYSRVLKTGRGCHSRLQGSRGKHCRRCQGLTQTTNKESQ